MTKKTPEKKQITWESALESLRNLVARRGENFVYKRPVGSVKCVNFNPGNHTPSCAIGVVLYDHGYRHKDLGHKNNDRGINALARDFNLELDGDLQYALGSFQTQQDTQTTYGKCLGYFEARYNRWTERNG